MIEVKTTEMAESAEQSASVKMPARPLSTASYLKRSILFTLL